MHYSSFQPEEKALVDSTASRIYASMLVKEAMHKGSPESVAPVRAAQLAEVSFLLAAPLLDAKRDLERS